MKLNGTAWHGLLAGLCALLALGACEAVQPKFKQPARLLYWQGQELMDQQLYSEATTKFQEAADQNPGTLLGSFAYLQLAEIAAAQEDWPVAQTNYQLFLNANQSSHLTPFVLYRLIRANHRASFTGVLFPEREVDRDMQPNRQIVQQFKRFFFLYPDSIFLEEVRAYAQDARVTLAEHERVVADFYFRREQFNAAASRYLYLLRNYPFYEGSDHALERLIRAYRLNQQPQLAEELERRVAELRRSEPGTARPAPPGGSASR